MSFATVFDVLLEAEDHIRNAHNSLRHVEALDAMDDAVPSVIARESSDGDCSITYWSSEDDTDTESVFVASTTEGAVRTGLDAVAGSDEVLRLLADAAPFPCSSVDSVAYEEQDGDGTLLYRVARVEGGWFSLDVKDGTVYPYGDLGNKTRLAPAVWETLHARLAHLTHQPTSPEKQSPTLHDLSYGDVPAAVRTAFDAALDRRRVPHRTYERSSQPRYAAVSEQSGMAGYAQDVFQVEVSVSGSSRRIRLGRVRDTRVGALLWCAHTLDARIDDVVTARQWVRDTLLGDEAATWLAKVAPGIASIPKPGGGGRKRAREE
jgi:hypothetical protein